MGDTVEYALQSLRELGSVSDMRAAAGRGVAPARRPRVNTHIHLPPNFSAFGSVRQAVELAAEQDVRVLGCGNYYNYDVYGEFAALARQRGIFPLFGTEIIALIDPLVKAGVKVNDPGNPGRIYACGKGITRIAPMSAEAQRLIGVIRCNDRQRMATMISKLEAIFAERGLPTGLTEDAVIDMVVRRHECPRDRVYLQERHVCQAFQEAVSAKVPAGQRVEKLANVLGTLTPALSQGEREKPASERENPVKIQNQIRSRLMKAGKPAFVEEKFLSFEEACRLILELGGIPCYPTLADGTSPICPYEDPVDKLIENIKGNGIHCAEFIPIRNRPEVLSRYVKAMRAAGLAITAGTEHNTLDLLPIEPACVGGAPVPDDVKEIFWEGACVVAAHKFLTLHGQCGFVDSQGRPNPEYKDDEARIRAFAQFGAAVMETYFRTTNRSHR